jgi:MFS family permease
MLIAARVIQAMGAALITPTSLALLLPAFPAKERGLAVGIWAAIGAVAASLGPTVGGLLAPVSWRLVFFVNVPVGLVCAVGTILLVPGRHDAEPGPLPDWLGASVLALAIAALSLDIVEGAGWGWLSLRTMGLALAVALLLWAFVARSQRHPAPVVDLSLARVRSFVLACAGTALIGGGLAAVLLSQILFVTTQWHFSTLAAGLCITPGPMVAGSLAILGGRLNGRVSPRLLTTLGAVAFGLAAAWWVLFVRHQPNYVTGMLPGMLLSGAGVGLTFAPLTALAAASLPVEHAATGLGVVNMARQIGTALGIAIFVAIVGTPGPSTPISTFQHGWLFIFGLAVLDGLAVTALRVPVRRREPEMVERELAMAVE